MEVPFLSPSSTAEHSDPHLPPSCHSNAIHPQPPILYLPPFLSSLPEHIDIGKSLVQTPFRPIVTETRLPDIDDASLSLHKALHTFRPLTSRYANTSYKEAFNWSELSLPRNDEREWYCVAFRSKRRSGSDSKALYDADKNAHEEAIQAGGLLLYWYGVPDVETGMNLATCIWQSRKHASAANTRPHHRKAVELAARSYEVYSLERHRLVKLRGESSVFVIPYLGGDVG